MKKPDPESPAPNQQNLTRCQFSFADGRHCRMPRWSRHRTLCLSHAREEQRLLALDRVGRELATPSGEFKTVSDVNHVLGKVFALFAKNRLARRDAVAFAYMGQLLLRSIPGVRREMHEHLGSQAWAATLEQALCPPARKNKRRRKNKKNREAREKALPQTQPENPAGENEKENENENEFDGMAALREVFSDQEISEAVSAASRETSSVESPAEINRRNHTPQPYRVDAFGVPHFS
jgi:hypothetical protein